MVFQKNNDSRSYQRKLWVQNLSWDINSYWQAVVLLAAVAAVVVVVFEIVDVAAAVAVVAELVENAMRLVLVEIASMTSLIDQVDDELALAV